MNRKKTAEAALVFNLNAKAFPKSWRTFDSLGLIYMVTGQKDLAVQNYQKSLDLNPANIRAKDNLKMLRDLPTK
jgi:Flp pilus assembly protein TadD